MGRCEDGSRSRRMMRGRMGAGGRGGADDDDTDPGPEEQQPQAPQEPRWTEEEEEDRRQTLRKLETSLLLERDELEAQGVAAEEVEQRLGARRTEEIAKWERVSEWGGGGRCGCVVVRMCMLLWRGCVVVLMCVPCGRIR